MYVTQFCTIQIQHFNMRSFPDGPSSYYRGVPSAASDAELGCSVPLLPSVYRLMSTRKLLVDVHTHVYLPRYASFLRARAVAPRIFSRPTPGGLSEDRLVILDNEPSGGRPVGPQVFLTQQERPPTVC